MIDQAVVLAAGRGSRLGALTQKTPKALVRVGSQSMLERALGGIELAGVSRAVIVVGYLGEQVVDSASQLSEIALSFSNQEQLLGTGHALAQAKEHLREAPFMFLWSDVLVGVETYRDVAAGYQGADGVLAVNAVLDPTSGAAVTVDGDGWVTSIVEKPPPRTSTTSWNNSGIGVLGPSAWPYVEQVQPSKRGEIELTDALSAMIHEGAKIKAVPVRGGWFDVGTPDQLAAARAALG